MNDLLVEVARLAAPDDECTDDLVRPQQRNDQDAAISGVTSYFLQGRMRSLLLGREAVQVHAAPGGVADPHVGPADGLVRNCGDKLIAHSIVLRADGIVACVLLNT